MKNFQLLLLCAAAFATAAMSANPVGLGTGDDKSASSSSINQYPYFDTPCGQSTYTVFDRETNTKYVLVPLTHAKTTNNQNSTSSTTTDVDKKD